MSATGEITTIGSEGWAASLGTAIARWRRRRAVRAQLAAEGRAAVGQERRAENAERMLLEDELQEFHRVFERTAALARLYRG
ncbi:hypothetical protein BH09ACT4_BH09ACT4_15630 [soil metagenome]